MRHSIGSRRPRSFTNPMFGSLRMPASGRPESPQSMALPPVQSLLSQVGDPSSEPQSMSERQDCPTTYTFFPYKSIAKKDENSYEGWLWSRLQGKNLAEWMKLHRTISPGRKIYGEEEYKCQKNKNTTKSLSSAAHRRMDVTRTKHSKLEAQRRDRHRRFQWRLDCHVSDFARSLADDYMALVKKMYGHNAGSNKSSQTGKDEQFLANVFDQLMSDWILQALEELIMKLQCWHSHRSIPSSTVNAMRYDEASALSPQQMLLSLAVRTQIQQPTRCYLLPSPISSDDE